VGVQFPEPAVKDVFSSRFHDMEWEIEIFKKSLLDLVISFLYENDVECVSLMRLPLHKTDIPVSKIYFLIAPNHH